MTRRAGSLARAATATALGAVSLLAVAGTARADQYDSRYGFAPVVGGGIAAVTHASPLPGFIGFTVLGVEALGEVPPWGGFLRAEYFSSGQDGRWQALSFALGASRRLFGQPEHLSLLARGGLVYQHWHGASTGCDVVLFIPSSCINQSTPNTPGNITATVPMTNYNGDALGILAGLRLELPIRPLYLAFDASFMPTFDVDSTAPGALIGLKFDLIVGFRDRRSSTEIADPQQTGPRFRRGS